MFYLDLLNLHPQFFQRPMPIHAIGDVISEAVAHHPFPIRFPDAVSLTDAAEGVAAGMRRSLRKGSRIMR